VTAIPLALALSIANREKKDFMQIPLYLVLCTLFDNTLY